MVMAQDLFVGSSTDGQIPKINTKRTVPNALQKKSDNLTKNVTQGMCNKNRVFEGIFSKLKPVHSMSYGFSFC